MNLEMNVKTKIGLGIIGSLFAFAVGNVAVNKINSNKENTINTECVEDTLRIMSLSEAAQFRAKLNEELIKTTEEGNEILKKVPQPDIPIDSFIRKIYNENKPGSVQQ